MKLLMNRIWDVVKSEQMLSAGDRVIVGFSGGADSVCLLFALQEIAKEIPLTLYAVHVNHGIRQEEAERDAAFCEKLCKEFKIEFTLIKADVMEIAKTRKISVEEAGRMVRYQAFWQKEELLYEENPHIPVKIAVAHHKNDQAETVLFRLARGTGLQGLSGINPVNGRIIRPLYNMTKEEIYQMVQKNQLAYVEDSSNQGNHYTRNKIRNQIIPLLESEICSQAVDHIATTASLLREADEYLKEQARIDAKKCVKQDGNGVTIQIPYFLERKTIIQKYGKIIAEFDRLILLEELILDRYMWKISEVFLKNSPGKKFNYHINCWQKETLTPSRFTMLRKTLLNRKVSILYYTNLLENLIIPCLMEKPFR